MYFRNKIHEQIYLDSLQNNPYRCTEQYLAALYILTSDKLLWRIARSKVKAKKIRFNAIKIYGTASIQYILVKVASDLYRDTAYSSSKELCDKYLISDRYFELIITAMHIRRYGYDYLPIKRTFN